MKTQKTDRRSERTRRVLGEALLSVLEDKRYEQITIQDVLDRADIGRSTFYAHYYDKDDLLSSQMEYIVARLSTSLDPDLASQDIPIPTLGFFQHVYGHRHSRWLQVMIHGQNGEVLIHGLQSALETRLERYLRARLPSPLVEVEIQVRIHVAVGGLLALVRWWIDTDLCIRPEQLDEHFQQVIKPLFARVHPS